MKIQILTTADYANVDTASGKMNILGAFNRITASQFPTTHPRLVLAVRLAADAPIDDGGPRNVRIVLTDEDGVELFQFATVVQLRRDEHGLWQDHNMTIEFNALQFPHPGTYVFTVLEEGEEIGDMTIDLLQAPSSA